MPRLPLAVITAALATCVLQAQPSAPKPLSKKQLARKQKSLERELSGSWKMWLNEDVVYIAMDQERQAFLRLKTDDDRQQFVEEFWLRRDNQEEHYRRIEYADAHFASAIPGWKTDRGRIYIQYGPAGEIGKDGLLKAPVDGLSVLTQTSMFNSQLTVSPLLKAQQNIRLAKAPAIQFKDLDAIANSDTRYDTLPMQVRAGYTRLTGATVYANIAVQFGTKAAVNVYGRVTTLTGHPVNRFEERLTTGSQIYSKRIPLAPGSYRLNIVAKDTVANTINTFETALAVPRYEEDQLAASSVILADRIERLPIDSVAAGPFVIRGSRVEPHFGDIFQQNETLGVYVEFYNLGMDEKTKQPQGVVEYEIVNNAGNQTVISQTEDLAEIPNASGFLVTVEKKLPLKTLAPGKYTLKLKLNDRLKNRSLTPLVEFTVTS